MKFAVAAIGLAVTAAVAASHPLLAAPAAPAEPSAGAVVIVVKAATACFSDMVRVTGIIVPAKTAIVNVDSEGYKVTEVMVVEGDQVTSGQILARLTRSADAGQQGMPQGAGGPQAGAAQQQQQQRPAGPASIVLRAPNAGLIMKSTARVGGTASMMAEPLFVIMVNNEFEVDVQVPSIHAPKLKFGEPARIAIDDRPERSGRVRIVGTEVDPKTQFARARLSLGADPSLRVGMFARATIDASRSCGISVPRSAVDYRTEGPVVQVIRGRTVETRRVVVGLLSDDDIEIQKGLLDGDMVVANAGTSLHDGDQVRPMTAGEIDQTRAR